MFEHASGKKVPAHDTAVLTVFTCSTGGTLSGTAINGKVIDRLGLVAAVAGAIGIGTKDRCLIAEPFLFGIQQAGSTSGIKNVSIDIKLQHGDSSGGGDMADYSTGNQPATANFFGAAMTTEFLNWTTGPVSAFSNPAQYELTGAKRFIRQVGTVTKFGVSTSTAALSPDLMSVTMGIDFREFTYSNPNPVSTSSSTSTA